LKNKQRLQCVTYINRNMEVSILLIIYKMMNLSKNQRVTEIYFVA